MRSAELKVWIGIFLLGVMALGATRGADAQRKAEPPTVDANSLPEPDIKAWSRAYQAWGSPRVVVLCVRDASGAKAAGEIGDAPWSIDETILTAQMRSAFEEIINHPTADIELVDPNALREATERLGNNLANAAMRDGVRLLANELGARLVFLIQLWGWDHSTDAPRSGRFQALDASTGRILHTQTFDWKIGHTAKDIKRYATMFADRFISDFEARTLNPSQFTLRLFGLTADPRQQRAVRDSLRGVRGVNRVTERGASSAPNPRGGRVESLTQFTVAFEGSFLDLAADTQDALQGLEDLNVDILDAAGATITLQLSARKRDALPRSALQGCLDLILQRDGDGDKQREALRELYKKHDSPSVAVLINRQPTTSERMAAIRPGEAGQAPQSGVPMVVVQQYGGGAGTGGPARDDRQREANADEVREIDALEVQTNLVETEIFKRLGPDLLSFDRVDATTARGRLMARMEKERAVFREDELVELLKQENIAKLLILGAGNTLREHNGEVIVTYTFKAIRLADARVLGVATASQPLFPREDDAAKKRVAWQPLDQTEIASIIADQAIQQLVCEAYQSWKPPSNLNLTLKNLQDSQDAEAFVSAIRGRAASSLSLEGRQSADLGTGQGTASMALSYTCDFNELFGQFRALDEVLDYQLVIESINPNEATIAIQR